MIYVVLRLEIKLFYVQILRQFFMRVYSEIIFFVSLNLCSPWYFCIYAFFVRTMGPHEFSYG